MSRKRRSVVPLVLLYFSGGGCILPDLNQRPIVDFTFRARADGVTVEFTANVTDPDGEVSQLSWDFGDRSPQEKMDPRAAIRAGAAPATFHTYPQSGEYRVVLTATDDNRQSEARDKAVIVGPNLPPSATFTATPRAFSLPPSVQVVFDATGSSDPEHGRLRYDWDFGDGGAKVENAPVSLPHFYTPTILGDMPPGASREVFVTLTVTDEAGRRASTQEVLQVTRALPSPTP